VDRLKTGWRTRFRSRAMLVAALVASAACGNAVRQGRSPAYLIVDSLTGASGAQPGKFGNVVESDVVTNVKATVAGQSVLVPTVFEDVGQVVLRLALKDPGTAN
jgi:hypothetical protein